MDLKYYKQYCENIEEVENFEKALADNFVGWHCHHRRGVNISGKELRALGQYYNVSADELIFLTESEHHSLHQKGKPKTVETKKKLSEAHKGKPKSEEHRKNLAASKKGKPTWNKGRKMSEEYCRKNSESHKGQTPWNKGIPMSDEQKKKLSEAHKGQVPWNKGKKMSKDFKKKVSENNKGKHWFNNGKINKLCYECPPGFVPGMLQK